MCGERPMLLPTGCGEATLERSLTSIGSANALTPSKIGQTARRNSFGIELVCQSLFLIGATRALGTHKIKIKVAVSRQRLTVKAVRSA